MYDAAFLFFSPSACIYYQLGKNSAASAVASGDVTKSTCYIVNADL